jgi:hypothetical protein
MENIRDPDVYKMETLVDSLETIPFDSSQEVSWNETFDETCQETCDEIEQAKLASLATLEESWRIHADYRQRWDTFQPILTRLKRLGMLDKNMQKVYDLLSVALYQYSYKVEVSISEVEYLFIERYMKFFRMKPEDRSNLQDALLHLRFNK